MPSRRTLLIAAVAAPFAAVLAALGLLRFGAFDGVIARSVSRTLATPVAFDGLSLGLLGRPRVVIEGLRVGPQGADGRLVDGMAVDAVLPWATLFGGPMRVDAVTLQGGAVVLGVDAKGQDNWSALLDRIIELAGPGPSAFDVGRLDVEDLKLRYVDHAANLSVRVAGLTLGASNVVPAKPFPAELRLAVSLDPWSAHGRLAGRAIVDPDRSRYGLELDRFLFWMGGGALPLGGIEASGKLSGFDYDMAADRAVFKKVQGMLAGAAFEAGGHVERVTTAPEATFALHFAPFGPRAFAQALGVDVPKTSDPKRLERAEFSATLAASAARIAVTGLEGSLDDTRFDGEVALPLAPAGPPRLRLHIDRIALDGYLPPAEDAVAESAGRNGANGEPGKAGRADTAGKSGKTGHASGLAKPAPRDGELALEELVQRLRELDLDATVHIDEASALDTRWQGLEIVIEPNAAVGERG